MAMKNAISIEGLNKTYPGGKKSQPKEALTDINLTIPQGSFFGLLGPNGAGKSTLINILAGLTNKTSGKVKINDIDLDDNPRGTRYQIGVVPQEVVLDPFFSVREMLEYFAGYYSVPKSQRRTQEIIDALHLTDKAGVNSRRLSGGMKRRVLIAKALVHSPPILVLDEPTAGVDVELRTQLWEYVRELNKQGTTVLLTTHYLEEAEELCDQIAIINHGKIIANDSTKSLMNVIDQKQLTLKVKSEISKVPSSFNKFESSLIDSHTINIIYKKSEMPINDLLQIISKENLEVCDLSTEEPDLEDIFRHLVSS
jgi:ABC-2 type transport system ATP-binding protein